MKKILFSVAWIWFLVVGANAQQNPVVHPTVIKYPVGFAVIDSLGNRPVVTDSGFQNEEFYYNRYEERVLNPNIHVPDFARVYAGQNFARPQSVQTYPPTILQNFAGQDSGAFPPDANGDVNDNYYFQVVNTTYAIYDKNGNLLAGPSDLNTIFDSSLPGAGYNDGDPIVLWDEQAGKWFYAEFSVSGSNDYMLIAVSQTDDPRGNWWSWSFDVDDMPDYMKFGIWQDGYYMATNTSNGNDVYVFERSKMITGDPNPAMIGFDNPNRPNTFDGFHCILPVDNDGAWAPAGTPGQFITVVDDDQSNPADELWLYQLNVDWNTPSNSTFQRTQTISIPSFAGNFTGDWDNIPQPGTSQKLDALSTVLMFRACYRNFNGDQRLVVAHTIAQSSSEGAIRWYELQNTSGSWAIRQQGQVDLSGISCWIPSVAINAQKEIAIGYTISDANSTYPSIYITGQTQAENNNASGVLDIDATQILNGQYAQTQANRWGDYANMSVDPNGKTFWFTTEYVKSNTHGTQIVAFEFPSSCTLPDTQASGFTVTAQTDNSMDISWTRGNGDRILVVARDGSAVDTDPDSGTAYTADAQFGNGDEIGTGNFVVYDGTGTSVQITGLQPGHTYYFALYEYATADNCYLTPAHTGSGTTDGAPTVETLAVSSIGSTTATANGNVISENGSAVTERGICWSTSPNPTIAGNHTAAGSGTGTFSVNLTGLTPSTTYYVRAYATNAYGTSYGDNVSFRTACSLVQDFPYLESFNDWAESSPQTACTADGSVTFSDCWQNITGDDADWDIISGATDSPDTGPYFDANDWYGRYVYLEASGCDNKTASFISPNFDFSSLNNPELRFNYLMWGADLGQLEVSVSTDGGNTWTSLWNLSGDQGYGWNEAVIDLNAYAGNASVIIKFTGQTGSDFRSDIAVDNVIIQEATGISSAENYCYSGGNMDYATAITGVILNEISVGSGKSLPYNNYDQIRASLKRGQTYDLTVRVNTDGDYDVYVRVWIDWNQDEDFTDSGEQYDLGYASNTSDGATNNSPYSLTVPSNAVLGKTRMRVSASYNTYQGPCDTNYDGEVEDYAVIVYDNCTSVAQWNGNLWKSLSGDTLSVSSLADKFLVADNLLYLKTEDLSACSASLRQGNTTVIGEGRYLQLSNDLYNRGYLELRNNASLIQTDDNSVIEGRGIYTMKRKTDTLEHYYDYVYLSSPVSGTDYTMGDAVANAWRYYCFDASIQDPSVIPNAGWVQLQSSDAFTSGMGYAVSAPDGFTGGTLEIEFRKNFNTFNNGVITAPVIINGNGASDGDDWNLLGNPYPSALDFDLFAQDNTDIQGSLYLWTNCAGLNANGQHQEAGYTVYNQTGATSACSGSGPTATQYIASGQGFMVEANTQGDVSFSNTYRTSVNNQFLNRHTTDRAWFDFTAESDGQFGQILIGFNPDATNDIDRLYDAHALSDRFYAIDNGQKFTILTQADWNTVQADTIPLGFTADRQGNYQISLNRKEGVLQNVHIYLIDYVLNELHDFDTGAYAFTAPAGNVEDRFAIVFTNQALKTQDLINAQLQIGNNGKGLFFLHMKNGKISRVIVTNISGQTVKTIDGKNQQNTTVDLTKEASGIYLLEIYTNKGKLTRKIIR